MVFNRALAVTVVFLAALVNAKTYTGKVRIVNGQNQPGLFLSDAGGGLFGITNNTAQALEVSIDSPGPANLIVTNAPSRYNIGGKGQSSPANLGVRSEAIVVLNNVGSTAPGSPPDGSNSESAIWNLNPDTLQIKAQWINTDNSKPETYISWYNETKNEFILSGDCVEYNTVRQYTPIYPLLWVLATN